MPDIFKSTMFFEGPAHGWTETYWQSQGTNDYDAAMASLQSLAQVRRTLLGEETRIKAVRVSLEAIKGDGWLVYKNFNGIKQEPAAEPDAAILFTLKDITLGRTKNVFLRGFWDSVESNAGDYKKNLAAWKTNMDIFKAFFAPGTVWGWWGKAVTTKVVVTGYTVTATQQLLFTTAGDLFPAPTFGTRQQVRLAGINGRSNLNGLQVVDVIDATHFKTYLPISNVPYQFGGTAAYQTKEFIKATRADDKRITTRKVGSPLLESVGHVKVRPRV
jgi:hypothetical protein